VLTFVVLFVKCSWANSRLQQVTTDSSYVINTLTFSATVADEEIHFTLQGITCHVSNRVTSRSSFGIGNVSNFMDWGSPNSASISGLYITFITSFSYLAVHSLKSAAKWVIVLVSIRII
jgi:hypothetical protein